MRLVGYCLAYVLAVGWDRADTGIDGFLVRWSARVFWGMSVVRGGADGGLGSVLVLLDRDFVYSF